MNVQCILTIFNGKNEHARKSSSCCDALYTRCIGSVANVLTVAVAVAVAVPISLHCYNRRIGGSGQDMKIARLALEVGVA